MRLVFLILAFSCLTLAQSPDEEEAVHFEGSANAPSDDEDIQEGSGLPVDQQYATSPVMTKMTSTLPTTTTTTERASTTTYSRPTTTLVRQQKVTTYPSTTTPRITTRVSIDGDDTPLALFAHNGILIAMAVFVLLIFVVIVVIICCCKKQKKGYTPAKQTLDT